jgi:hypothetical protein
LPECSDSRTRVGGNACHDSYARNFRNLLRLDQRTKRQQQSAKNKRSYPTVGPSNPKSKIKDAESGHLITLSALARMCGEMVAPICFAVFKLITISNLVGCSTGMSAGLAPFKILAK